MKAVAVETSASLHAQADALQAEWQNALERAGKHVELAARLEVDYRVAILGLDPRDDDAQAQTLELDYFEGQEVAWNDSDAITHAARAEALYLEAQTRLERMAALRWEARALERREAIRHEARARLAAVRPSTKLVAGFLRRLSASWGPS